MPITKFVEYYEDVKLTRKVTVKIELPDDFKDLNDPMACLALGDVEQEVIDMDDCDGEVEEDVTDQRGFKFVTYLPTEG
jgi:hypothetical protein